VNDLEEHELYPDNVNHYTVQRTDQKNALADAFYEIEEAWSDQDKLVPLFVAAENRARLRAHDSQEFGGQLSCVVMLPFVSVGQR